jgi:tungstate transport system ATP-binding protein
MTTRPSPVAPIRSIAAPALEARDLVVPRNGGFRLEIGRLAVGAGRVLAVLGVNGAGKSTLLEVLALLRVPDSGLVCVHGEPARGAAARRRLRLRLGLALQDPFLLRGRVIDNVALPLRLRGVPVAEARRRAILWLERLGVAGLADRRANEVSGGEARRVSLARSLVADPEVLFLDEPFAALDPPTRDGLLRDFRAALEPRTAVVLVTHDRIEAQAIADEVAILHAGRILQWGPMPEVFGRPADPTVASIVGHGGANLVDQARGVPQGG